MKVRLIGQSKSAGFPGNKSATVKLVFSATQRDGTNT
ncbi:hypothetical protein SRABI83_02989 [Arthrobacter sp. Bi83]|jgi:hypothetical protein|nr:hypothetical protein SRABI83_02989 [Arthrobacter sp. Bi83]